MDPMQDFEKYINAYSRYNQGMLDPGNPAAGQYETYVDPATNEQKRRERQWTAAEQQQMAIARDALQLAAAVPIKLSYEEFKILYDSVADLRDSYEAGWISEAQYQEKLWDAADGWEEIRAQQAHYTPQRTDDGQPVDWDPRNPAGMQERLAGSSSIDPGLAPVIESARKGELAGALEAINARKPSGNEAVDTFAATKQGQQSVPSLNMDLGELASKSDKHLNDWLLNGKLLNVSQAPPDSLGSTEFGGHSLDSIQAKPVGQRDHAAVKAWIDAVRAHHAKQVAESQTQSVSSLLANDPDEAVRMVRDWAQGLESDSPQKNLSEIIANDPDEAVRMVRDWASNAGSPPVINTPEAVEALTNSEPSEESPTGAASSPMDALHMGLDAIGLVGDAVVPGAGVVADGANALLYLARAASDPEHAGEHLKNALISGVSMVPFLGDAAKGFKYGAKTGTKSGKVNAASGILGSLFGGMAGGAGHGGGGGAAAAGGAGHGGGGHGANLAAAAANAVGGMGGGGGAPPAQQPGGAGGGQPGPQGMQSWLSAIGNATAIFGVASSGVYAVTKSFEKLNEWLNEVDRSSRKLIEENRELAKHSGTTAMAYAQLDRDRFLREVEKAQAMSGPLSRLTAAQSEYEDVMQEWNTPYDQLDADIQALKTGVATEIVRYLKNLDVIARVIEWWYSDQKSNTLAKNMVDAMARDSEARMANRKF